MKDFLINKHNIAVSTYITDLNPTSITTNGALTIIDNTDSNNYINGLVPNSYNIFLDNLFLAGGFGFSSYNQYENASYIISTYSDIYSYIINELDALHLRSFNIAFSYNNTENKLDKEYTAYGWTKQYKKLNIERTNETTYTISLEEVNNNYINDISIDIIGVDENNFAPVDENVEVVINLHKNDNTASDEKYLENAPNMYFNNELILSPNGINNGDEDDNDSSLIVIKRTLEAPNTYDNNDLIITCKRNDELVYEHNFGTIKWRYKIMPFNTNTINILLFDLSLLKLLNEYKFSDIDFDISRILTTENLIKFKNIIDRYANNTIYIDNLTDIEFNGEGYIVDDIYCFSYDYFIIESDIVKFNYYYNNIKNNNWDFIEFSIDNIKKYRLYQSPQKYIGIHTWSFTYRNE